MGYGNIQIFCVCVCVCVYKHFYEDTEYFYLSLEVSIIQLLEYMLFILTKKPMFALKTD